MSLTASGARELQRRSLARAMDVLREATDGGRKAASKRSVEAAAKTVQAGGRTVMSMDYYHARGGRTVLPQAYFGRPSVACANLAQRGGAGSGAGTAAGAASVAAIKDAAAAENVRATAFGLKAAHAVAADYARDVSKLLKHDNPRAKAWTAAHVKRAIAK